MANKGLEGFPTRNAIILVVTVPKWGGVLGGGVDPGRRVGKSRC